MIPSAPGRAARFEPGPRRQDDRRIAAVAIAIAVAYLAAAALAAVAAAVGALPAKEVPGWLPLHLALAGGASTAIAGVMPFFVAALAAGRPAPLRVRASAVLLVAAGAALVAARGIAPTLTLLPVVGGVVYLAGIATTLATVRASGRGGLAVRRPIVTLGYSLALVNVAIGATLGTLFVAGWTPVLERWGLLRPAHAWTNLLGFVSLVIVSTLLHFLPTVLGTRIVPRGSGMLGVLGLAAGSPVVVAGLAIGWSPLAGAGAVVTVMGLGSLALEASRVARARGRWTTDAAWHRFTGVALLAGTAWFVVGAGLAALRIVVVGTGLDAWSTPLVGGPLVVGWVAQVLAGSWTHLVPSIGPGGPREHAAQRAILGRAATVRLVALNAGAALVAVGWPLGIGPVAAAGALVAAVTIVWSGGLAVAALRVHVAG